MIQSNPLEQILEKKYLNKNSKNNQINYFFIYNPHKPHQIPMKRKTKQLFKKIFIQLDLQES